jgi:predicted acyltransferase
MADLQEPETRAQEPKKVLAGRVMSIDALRGFDMFWIIGGWYIFDGLHKALDNPTTAIIMNQLKHVEWEGFVFEDLIMPLFLFIVGVVMPFSFNKRLGRGDSKKKLYIHVVLRSVILFVLGMIAQGDLLELDSSKLKIYCNTLQAIAAGYLISSIIILNMRLRWQIVTTVLLLLLFWALMMLVPFPGRVADRLYQDANLATYIDRVILQQFDDGLNYTWILSSITFACTVMLGVMAGHLLRTEIPGPHKVYILAALGIGTLVLGSLWGGWFFGIGKFYTGLFPIIKRLWTSSFVLFSAGLSYLLLALFYLVIDVCGFKKWAYGFVVIGTNAIFVYMLTHLINFRSIAGVFVEGLNKFVGPWNDFLHAVAGFVLVWLILWWMYRKKSFIKI